MPAVGADDRGKGTGDAIKAPRLLRILVVLRAINMDRISEGFLRCTLNAGHTVHVALENTKDRAGRAGGETSVFDVLEDEYSTFSYDPLPVREERWLHTATRLRCAIDFLRYYEPEFAQAEILRRRARNRAPWYVRVPAALRLFRVAAIRRTTDRVLRAIERRVPVSEQSLEMMRQSKPDVVVVSPLIEIGSPQGDHLRAADSLGIPTALVVASWDNLTTKGVIRDVPDSTIVWNEDQVREATKLHGVPAESVVATGAHSHDHWFSWQPATGPEEFASKVGLAPDRPFLLYVCSSGFIAGGDEVAFVREWFSRLGASGDPELASLGVLVRPHPQNFLSWRDADLDEPGRIVVWPRGGVAPTDRQSKEDYFDSLYHAKAVVGINTSALVDSAIVGRPVFTMIHEQFRGTQTGTLHFSYLAREEGDGLLHVADSWDEHFDQLAAALRSEDGHRDQIESFLGSFVRPHGLDRPAAPLALKAIERTAQLDKQPVSQRGVMRWLVGAIASLLGRLHLVRQRLRPRALRRRVQRWRKRMHRRRVAAQRRARAEAKAARRPKAARQPKPAKEDRRPKAAKDHSESELAHPTPGADTEQRELASKPHP
jgi:hypothetical protein